MRWGGFDSQCGRRTARLDRPARSINFFGIFMSYRYELASGISWAFLSRLRSTRRPWPDVLVLGSEE